MFIIKQYIVGGDDFKLYAIDAISGKKKWSFATRNRVSSSPIATNGIVYVGSDDKKLYAIDAITGEKKWEFLTGNVIYSSPCVETSLGYVYRGLGNIHP